jgi:hypothetical protein
MKEFTIRSKLDVAPQAFWAATSMQSVNWELAPLVRMTAPPEWRDCALSQWQAGRPLFKSWILLFGILPVDLHSFRLEAIDPEGGFLEASSSWVNKAWRHERKTLAGAGQCTVVDHVRVLGRCAPLTALLMPVYKWVFRHRHARLRSKFGPQSRGA